MDTIIKDLNIDLYCSVEFYVRCKTIEVKEGSTDFEYAVEIYTNGSKEPSILNKINFTVSESEIKNLSYSNLEGLKDRLMKVIINDLNERIKTFKFDVSKEFEK